MTRRNLLVRSAIFLAIAVFAVWIVQSPAWAAEPVQWKMTGVVTSGAEIEEWIEGLSEGDLEITSHKPGELFPHLDLFKAIGDGRVDLGIAPIGFWAKDIPAAPLFSAVPFGPAAPEYLAWMHHGGGHDLLRDMLDKHGIYPINCTINAPEASGWFRNEIKSVDDLAGLKMRFFGLGAKVMEKLGVSTTLLPPSAIYAALESGEIDATEFSSPSFDIDWGFHKIAKHYYFPGWHQPYTLTALMINKDGWESLTDIQRRRVEAACAANLIATLAESEADQFEALEKLKAEGVQLHRWSAEMLDVFRGAWNEVAAEMTAKDPDFKRAWASLKDFREKHRVWRDLALAD